MSAPTTALAGARVFSPNQILLPQISYTSFTYPGDEEALRALKNIPGAPAVLTYLQENFTEQLVFVEKTNKCSGPARTAARDVLGLHEGGQRIKCACAFAINSKLRFCPQCGAVADATAIPESPAFCSGCGQPLTADAKFCPGCGKKQKAVSAANPSAMDKLKSTAAGLLKR